MGERRLVPQQVERQVEQPQVEHQVAATTQQFQVITIGKAFIQLASLLEAVLHRLVLDILYGRER